MKPIRQNVIPYVLVLLVALAIPQIASADDPCQGFNDEVTKFVSEMPQLSSSELTVGRFDVENNKISYLVNGQEIFKREWHESCGSGELDKLGCSAQITPILGLGGYGGLHIARQARHIGLTCDHFIFPSPSTNSFKSASQPWFITVKDLDNDNVSEIITHEYQQWALDCDLCLACIDATAWNNIYHFSSEGKLIPVNAQFPQRYAELLTSYKHQYDRFKQDKKNYVNSCNSQQLSNQFQALITRAEKLASQCTAPNANISKKFDIPSPNCLQLWEYYLYTRLLPIFSDAQELISLAEKRVLTEYDTINEFNLIGGSIFNVLLKPDPDNALKLFNAVFEGTNLLLNLAPYGEVKGKDFALDLVNWLRGSLAVSAITIAKGTTGSASPLAAVGPAVELANRFRTFWYIQANVVAERNAINLAREYLNLYYRNGSNKTNVAAVYELPSSATTEEVLKSIAKKLGMTGVDDRVCSPQIAIAICSQPQEIREDYNLKKASQWVSSFKDAISNAANVCLQGSTCTGSQVSPTSMISAQKPIKETLNKQSDKLKTNKTAPTAKSKVKKDTPIECNKGSLVSSPSTGSAEGALNKYGTGTDGCTQ